MKALTTLLIAAAMLGVAARGFCADKASRECDKAQKIWDAGHPEKARQKLEEVLRKWPGYERARVMMGLLHVQRAREAEKARQWDRAAAEYGEALTFDPDEPYWKAAFARALESKGEAPGAQVVCAEAARLSPLDDLLAHGCGLKSATAKHHAEAKREAAKSQVTTYQPGIDVMPPVPLHRPEPPYTEKARQARFQGMTVLSVVIGPEGAVRSEGVAKPLGLGLDESALKTVRTWTFKPATFHGKPVPVHVLVEVAFRLN